MAMSRAAAAWALRYCAAAAAVAAVAVAPLGDPLCPRGAHRRLHHAAAATTLRRSHRGAVAPAAAAAADDNLDPGSPNNGSGGAHPPGPVPSIAITATGLARQVPRAGLHDSIQTASPPVPSSAIQFGGPSGSADPYTGVDGPLF